MQSLITAVVPSGLNLQILGFFEGTVDQISLRTEKTYKVGQKIKARVLYDVPATSPPKFALALAEHVIGLEVKHAKGADGKDRVTLQEAYPVGTIFEEAKVASVEQERGLMIEVEPGVQGFVHVSCHFSIRFKPLTTLNRYRTLLMTTYHPSHRPQERGRLTLCIELV